MVGVPTFLLVGLMLAVFMVRDSLSVLLFIFRTIEFLLIWFIAVFLLELRTVIRLLFERLMLIVFFKGRLISIGFLLVRFFILRGIILLFGIKGRIAVGLNPGSVLLVLIVGLITAGGFFLLSVIRKQEIQSVGFGIDLDAGFDKSGSGHAQPFDGVAHKHSVMNMSAATGWGLILKDSDVDS